MGNYISCTLAGPVISINSSIRATKVIFPSGETRRLYEPSKAAELMLDAPNSFLVNAKSLQIGRRFSALNADEDLQVGGVYVFFPMTRLRSAVSPADMGALFLSANSAAKRTARVLPDCVAHAREVAPKLILDVIKYDEFSMREFQHRLSICRSKKPLLDTIVEEAVCLR